VEVGSEATWSGLVRSDPLTAPERFEESLAENRDVLTVGAAPDERS